MAEEKYLELHLDEKGFRSEKQILEKLIDRGSIEKNKLKYQIKEHKLQKIVMEGSVDSLYLDDTEARKFIEMVEQIDNLRAEESQIAENALREKESVKSQRELELEGHIAKLQDNIKLLTQKLELIKSNAQQGIDKLKQALGVKIKECEDLKKQVSEMVQVNQEKDLRISALEEQGRMNEFLQQKLRDLRYDTVTPDSLILTPSPSVEIEYIKKLKPELLDQVNRLAKREGLRVIFGMKRVSKHLLSLIDDESFFELKNSCRYFRWHLSLDSTRLSKRFQKVIQDQNRELQKFYNIHRRLSDTCLMTLVNFEQQSSSVCGDNQAFMIYKFMRQKKRPGEYMHKSLTRSKNLFDDLRSGEQSIFDPAQDQNSKFQEIIDLSEQDFAITRESIDQVLVHLKIEEEIPKDIIQLRNQFFDQSCSEVTQVIKEFSEKLKTIKKTQVQSLIVKLVPSFLELFYMSRMLYQEAKELDGFKD